MRVLVAGANGDVGRLVIGFLRERDHEVRGIIRDPAQASQLEDLGAEAVVADLEGEVDHAVDGSDAVIFAAGAGAMSGAEKLEAVDHRGAIKIMDAAQQYDARRYVMLSAMGVDEPENLPQMLQDHANAKRKADEALRSTDLDYTIVRPDSLTDDSGRGTIAAARSFDQRGQIAREDVAQTLVTALDMETLYDQTFEILAGDVPIEEALEQLE